MRRHLAAVALAGALREIIERQFARSDAAAEDERAIAVIAGDVIAIPQLHAEGGERFVAHPGNVKMPFALAIQILLAQIAMPALEQDGQEAQFIFFAQGGHRRWGS